MGKVLRYTEVTNDAKQDYSLQTLWLTVCSFMLFHIAFKICDLVFTRSLGQIRAFKLQSLHKKTYIMAVA